MHLKLGLYQTSSLRHCIALSKVIFVVYYSFRNDPMRLKEAAVDSVSFELEDRRNVLDRVLPHFSHLEKETKRLDDLRYLVTHKYDRQDETEMVIRILSFGSAIKVVEPESFTSLLLDRIEKQKQLATFSPGTNDALGV